MILNAQDWDDPESKSDPISEEQLKEINRLMGLIVGEPTTEQMEDNLPLSDAPSS